MFDAVRELVAATGAVSGSERRVLDSTVLDDAVARQDTVTMLRVQMRRLGRLVPQLADVWVRAHNLDPAGLVVDGLEAGERVGRSVGAAPLISKADAAGLLALVAGQDTEPGTRRAGGASLGAASDRVLSVVDPESRHAHKIVTPTATASKAHVCAEPDTGLITAVDLTAGNTADAEAAAGLLDGRAGRHRGPVQSPTAWHRRAASRLKDRA